MAHANENPARSACVEIVEGGLAMPAFDESEEVATLDSPKTVDEELRDVVEDMGDSLGAEGEFCGIRFFGAGKTAFWGQTMEGVLGRPRAPIRTPKPLKAAPAGRSGVTGGPRGRLWGSRGKGRQRGRQCRHASLWPPVAAGIAPRRFTHLLTLTDV